MLNPITHDNDNNQRPAEFDALLVAYLPGLRKFAKRHTTHDKVEELVQETVAYALSKWANYRADEGTFATWMQWQMRSILTRQRESAGRAKRAAKEVSFDVVELAARLSEPARQENIVDAVKVLRRLPDSYGGRMLMRYAEGETCAEIGRPLGLGKNRIQQIIAKTRASLCEMAA